MSQSEDIGLNTKPWPILVDHYSSDNDEVDKTYEQMPLWITVCVIGVKDVLISGIKNKFIFIEKSPCTKDLAPYNALPLTRQTALLSEASRQAGRVKVTSGSSF
ncbi:hypothetical protein [Shewanella sp. Isolate7]|uniref:hypothetical protein n=1 Tax=Shewanella sp. Isolate7 TaxID=2908528 RepID=UPI001EFC68D2|nr:hypothetical protein [Shewanella sp. Isolate7]MCG9723629.1 hypothetical protein [Shewanella sp. Isolate7]